MRYFAYGEDTHTLRLTSELVDLRVGYAKWIRRAKLIEPFLARALQKYDATLLHRKTKYVRHVSSRVISLLTRIPSPCALKVNFQIFGRGMRSGFDELALIERHLKRLCINMIHAVASYLCRDIEVVITGLTRNQFVSNHTRVRIPLSAPCGT